jgi:Phosphopantetheinyl transferase
MKLKILIIKVEDNLSSQRNGADKLLRYMYGENFIIKKSPSGKPYLDGVHNYTHFNISHSGNYTVCAFSDVAVGIDIEKIRPISQRVIDRFLNGCSQSEAISKWTQRESFGKMTGNGFNDTRYDEIPHMFKEYKLDDYIITVCVDTSRTGGLIVSDADFPEQPTWYQE